MSVRIRPRAHYLEGDMIHRFLESLDKKIDLPEKDTGAIIFGFLFVVVLIIISCFVFGFADGVNEFMKAKWGL